MFRKILLLAIIATFIFAVQVNAAQVSIESAKEAAQGFLVASGKQFRVEIVEGPKPRVEPKGYKIVSTTLFTDDETEEVLAYIAHLSPQGFIALSTDTEINPVIAYSLHSNFVGEDNPRNTLCWMLRKDMKQRHSRLKTISKSVQLNNKRKWNNYLSKAADAPAVTQVITSDGGGDSPLDDPLAVTQWPPNDDTGWLDTTWDQSSPYNDRCPIVAVWPHVRVPTGAIATGMGQIINYWRYPNSVQFEVEDNYWLDDIVDPITGFPIQIVARTASFSFDWPTLGPDSMAKLCYSTGVATQLQYNWDPIYPDHESSPGTTGALFYARDALDEKFQYHSADYGMPLEIDGYLLSYDDLFWDILESNMKAGRPALLGLKAGALDSIALNNSEESEAVEKTIEEIESDEKAAFVKKFKFDPAADIFPNRIYVRFKSTVDPDSLAYVEGKAVTNNAGITKLINLYGASNIKKTFRNKSNMRKMNVFTISLDGSKGIAEVLSAYNKHPDVVYAEPIGKVYPCLVPHDTYYPWQWAYERINAEPAWDLETGDPDIIIAIIDTGVDWNHPDLAANIWSNAGEAANGGDTDANGYVDDIRGWDFGDSDNNPTDDVVGHGTHCAGIAAAVTDNNTGVAGTAWLCKIMPLKIADSTGALTGDWAEAIEYAADNGAKVISMSFGGGPESETNQTAITYAFDAGVFLAAAAGNAYTDIDEFPFFPAMYEHVTAVAATDQNDFAAVFTNYGSAVDISAPGVEIRSTIPTFMGGYDDYDGTSMACPFVAGAAGLIFSYQPDLTPEIVETILMDGADDIDALNPDLSGELGAGRLNLYRALRGSPYYGTVPVVCDGYRDLGSTPTMLGGDPLKTEDPAELAIEANEDLKKADFNKHFNFNPQSDYVPDKIFVRFKSKVDPASVKIAGGKAETNTPEVNQLLGKYSISSAKKVFRNPEKVAKKNVFSLSITAENMKDVLDEFNAHPDVVYAEPIYYRKLDATPTDDDYSTQWAYPKISAEAAWDISTGDSSIIVAVLDTGVDWDHPDLAANIWSNDDEAIDGTDTDGNGYVDDIRGWDCGDDDNNPIDNATGGGHGTGCAGIVAAVTNNVSGLAFNVAGTAWDCTIMPLKVATSLGALPDAAIVEAIEYAADNGAHVISMSFGGYGESQTLETACEDAYDADLVLVASAGNDGLNVDINNHIPSGYDSVMAVAATDQDDKRSVWNAYESSNYGNAVDISAPGTDILTTYYNNSYAETFGGTSAACPFVAAAAALLRSVHGADLENWLVIKVLKDNADDIDSQNPGYEGLLGSGRLNLELALGAELPEGFYHFNFCLGDDIPEAIDEAWYDVALLMDPDSDITVEEGVLNIIPGPAVLSVSIALSGGVRLNDGPVIDAPVVLELDPSDEVKITAVPGPGTLFSHWTGSYNGTQNPVWLSGYDFDVTIVNTPDESDPDGDGSTNYEEAYAGTDPEDPESVFECTGTSSSGDSVIITWSSISGKTYRVFYSDDTFDPGMAWTLAESGIPASGTGTTSWTDDGSHTGTPPGSVGNRYYKIEVQE